MKARYKDYNLLMLLSLLVMEMDWRALFKKRAV